MVPWFVGGVPQAVTVTVTAPLPVAIDSPEVSDGGGEARLTGSFPVVTTVPLLLDEAADVIAPPVCDSVIGYARTEGFGRGCTDCAGDWCGWGTRRARHAQPACWIQ